MVICSSPKYIDSSHPNDVFDVKRSSKRSCGGIVCAAFPNTRKYYIVRLRHVNILFGRWFPEFATGMSQANSLAYHRFPAKMLVGKAGRTAGIGFRGDNQGMAVPPEHLDRFAGRSSGIIMSDTSQPVSANSSID